MVRKIITTFVYPPIPVRSMDWQAYFDGDEPNDDGQMKYGSGETEQQAIDDLLDGHDMRRCRRCGEIFEYGEEPDGCEDFDCGMRA